MGLGPFGLICYFVYTYLFAAARRPGRRSNLFAFQSEGAFQCIFSVPGFLPRERAARSIFPLS